MSNLRLHFISVLGTVAVFILSLWLNERIFTHSEFVRGVNWVFLPAGVRLLATLLLGADGAIGLFVASLIVNFGYYFPHDTVRSIVGAILASIAPYGVYRLARERYGLSANLSNLTPGRLLVLVLAYSFASPLLHHLWFALRGDTQHFAESFFAMFVGELSGTLIVIYTLKGALALIRMCAGSGADSSRDA
jgi:hypothetical protein